MNIFRKSYRLVKKYILLIIRSNDTPHHIALGVAIGLCCGVAIPLGQMLLAILLAFIFKANKVFAVAATFISNPYTSPIIYPFFCYLGAKIIGVELTFAEIQKFVHDMISSFSWSNLLNMGTNLLVCYLVGGILIGLILGVVGYFVTYRLAVIHKKIRTQRIKKNIEKKHK
jgi:uncharacterized protein